MVASRVMPDQPLPAPAPAPDPDPGSTNRLPRLSFGGVADAYARARPTYPRAAATWLTSPAPARVLELGAGTGLLTEQLQALGHRVLATDPLEPMLRHLVARLPVHVAQAAAERIPLRARSVDAVVGAQAFHWFDLDRALPEIARVLRPGGHVGLVWNLRDERIPWVKRLGSLLGGQEQDHDPTNALLASHLFGYVETATFRSWQPLDRARLHDLVRSRSSIALMSETERERVLAKVDELYAEYGRGHDGMLLPYVTHCYRAVVRPPALVDPSRTAPDRDGDDGGDADALLVDFR